MSSDSLRRGRAVAAFFLASSAAVVPAAGAPPCRPIITLAGSRFVGGGLAVDVAVDANRCSERSGRFSVSFVMWKENAPDETFPEEVSWSEGGARFVLSLANDEAIADLWIRDVPRCRCKTQAGS